MTQDSNYVKRMAQGSVIVFVSSIVAMVIGIILRAFFARTLTLEEFGLLYSVLAFIGLFNLFKSIGLNMAVIKYIPEFIVKKQKWKIKSMIISVSIIQLIVSTIVISLVLYFSSFWATYFFSTELSIPVLYLIGISFIVSIFFHLLQSCLQGFQNMKFFALMEPIHIISLLIFSYLAIVIMGMGVVGAALSYVLAAGVGGIIGFILLVKTFPHFKTGSRIKLINFGLTKKLFNEFSSYAFFGGFATILVTSIGTVFLTFFRSLEEVAFFQIAVPLSDFVGLFIGAIVVVFFPMISEIWTRGKKKLLSKGLHFLLKFSFLTIVPIAILIFSFPEILISLFFTDAYLPAIMALQILVFAVFFKSIMLIFDAVFKGIGRTKKILQVFIYMAIVNVAVSLVLIPLYGFIGAAITSAITYLFAVGVFFYYLKKEISISFPITPLIKIIISGLVILFLIMGIKNVLFINPWLELIISIAVGAIVYTTLIIALKVVQKDDLKILARIGIKFPGPIVKAVNKFVQ